MSVHKCSREKLLHVCIQARFKSTAVCLVGLHAGLEADEAPQRADRPDSGGPGAARDRRVPGELLEVLVEKLLAAGKHAGVGGGSAEGRMRGEAARAGGRGAGTAVSDQGRQACGA